MLTVNASRVRELLFQRRLSARQLALQAGMNQATALKCLRDGATVALTTVATLAEFFGVNGNELILGTIPATNKGGDAIKLSYRRVFAERLKQARQAAGMNQTEFGASLGLSQRAISNYESADREPSIATIARFAQKLHRPLNWFFGLEDTEAPS